MSRNNLFVMAFIVLAFSSCTEKPRQLLILHTNDSHSQIDPTERGGGFAARAALVDSLRRVCPDMLLLDGGDMVQGTPYFNLYHGRIEVEAYNRMGYDVVTLGNHEFDNGVDSLSVWLSKARFHVVAANYDVRGTVLEPIVKPYVILRRSGLNIAVIGLGVNPDKLILKINFEPVGFRDPIVCANYYADSLKTAGACDFVIALSHLGFNTTTEGEASDSILASQSRNIDLILGGHTHKVRGVFRIPNVEGREITVMQTSSSAYEADKVVLNVN
ncbi:MAG: metallophosphatase [Prevotellaceae bacterium]|jgi:5'-nucleotidase|nr:metallophosphatase [Prevotellaceae bacterium]